MSGAHPIKDPRDAEWCGANPQEAADVIQWLCGRLEDAERERDTWIANTKLAVWSDSEYCKLLEARLEAAEARAAALMGVGDAKRLLP